MVQINSKERFSNRVDNYVKYRPTYPAEAIDSIIANTGINDNSTIADVGSGTGKLTRLMLERGFPVLAVEPNQKMREAAEKELSVFPGFRSILGSAEETTIADHTVELITVAQAFHWFDHKICKVEFQRILKSGCYVALVWNRRDKTTGFMKEYHDAIMQWYEDYPNEAFDRVDANVYNEFFEGPYNIHTFSWCQTHDFDGLWGRVQSSSYSPTPGHPNHEPLKAALQDLFNRYHENGLIRFEYETEVVIGKL